MRCAQTSRASACSEETKATRPANRSAPRCEHASGASGERQAEVAHVTRLSRVSMRTSLVHAQVDATRRESGGRVRATKFLAAWQCWHGALAKGHLLEAHCTRLHELCTNCSSVSPPVVVKEQPCDAKTCQTHYDRRRVMSTARSFKRVWQAGRLRPGRSKQRRADLLSLQHAHPGCCGACLTSRSGHRELERGSSSQRASMLSDAKQRLGVLCTGISPSESGIRDEPI